jgi:hypothetical protein
MTLYVCAYKCIEKQKSNHARTKKGNAWYLLLICASNEVKFLLN